MRRRLLAALTIATLTAGEAVAEPGPEEEAPADTAAAALAPAHAVLGLFGGHGFAQRINGSSTTDLSSFGLRWSGLGRLHGTGPLRGRPAFAIEVLPAITFDQDPRPYAVGFNMLYEHHFAASAEVLPVFRLGVGALSGTQAVPAGETRYNFSVLAGLAIDFPIGGRRAFGIEYRFHHVSNLDTGTVNPGINAHTILGGLSWYR